MDGDTIKPEIPESLVTDEKTHNAAGTDLTISALYYSGTGGEGVTELELDGQLNSAELGINNEVQEQEIGNGLIEPSPGTTSDSVVASPLEDNVHELLQTNKGPSSPDHPEDFKPNISTPYVKQEIIDVVVKEGDVIKKEIDDNQIIEKEIHGGEEEIHGEDGMNYPLEDNLKETVKIELVQTEDQPVVMKNELTEFERINENSDDQRLMRNQKTSTHPNIAMIASSDGGNDDSESCSPSSGEELDHEAEKMKGSKLNHQLYKNKKRRKVEELKGAAKGVSSKDESQIGVGKKVKSGQNDVVKKPHGCEICGEHFKTYWCLKNHLRLHTVQWPYSCDYCDKKFSQLSHYKAHLLRHKNKNNKCSKCDKNFIHVSELFLHEKSHLDSGDYTCAICQESFPEPSALYNHRKRHHVKPFLCLYAGCGKEFERLHQLQMHERSHHEVKSNVCKICDETFDSPNNLRDHVKTHSDGEVYQCSQCDEHFKLLQHLKDHMLTHSTDVLFKCQECDKEFLEMKHLRRHVLSHSDEKSKICILCGVAFHSSGDLKRHQSVHTGVKPYKCTECGKSFTQLGNLKSHQILHTGEKPFACDFCDKTFAQRPGLYRHRKSHQRVEPFKCADCGKSFSQLDQLISHKLVHKDEKPFACKICAKTYSQASGLLSHMEIHQKVKLEMH